MTSTSNPQSGETSSVPLADYFFICGLESSTFEDIAPSARPDSTLDPSSPSAAPARIDEDESSTSASEDRPLSHNGEQPSSARRAARFSYEARKSVGSYSNLETPGQASNRSSATIRAVPPDASQSQTQSGNQNWEDSLKKFTTERDTFLDDIRFSAGQVANPDKPRPKPKTQRIIGSDEMHEDRGVGSIRRRISTMNPLSRSATLKRRASARQSKRLSGYNSVIPSPQRFAPNPNMHPLKRPYEPVLLDQYPPKDLKEEAKRRAPFPDYVPMFVFPNDVNVVSSDERPRSTWHGFAMTNSDGSKLYGMCIICWMPLPPAASEELERQCESWRNRNMTNEERELAKDLSERLAGERAKLSLLLSELPLVPSGSEEREFLEDEISAVEERITLIGDALRPVRHGAASKIDGLTDGDSGFWAPRAYGILGRDHSLVSFWKEWLRAVSVPMMNGAIQRIPPNSPRTGVWQPLERYVVNICTEAPSPITSLTQVELAIRELRMYARKEAVNEIPGSRNLDLYPLFRALDVPDILILFEYVLAESRIIFLSSHTSMLYLACAAITQLLYPLKWSGVYIPVLPARLIQALEAPCPYIVGIERRYEGVELPEDDFVLVDLDNGIIEATSPPTLLPRQQRRKLMSILQLAAAHRYRYGVKIGPPAYAQDAYPADSFPTENPSVFTPYAIPSNLSHLTSLNSAHFGGPHATPNIRPPLFNVFLNPRNERRINTSDRPPTGSTYRTNSPPSPGAGSPASANFPPFPGSGSSLRGSSLPRTDSASALQASLREKRSGVFEGGMRRNSSFGMGVPVRRPSLPFAGHNPASSVSTLSTNVPGGSNYAPSMYAQSTLAASTIMPSQVMQPVRNTETTIWSEGHCLELHPGDERILCTVCDEKAEDGIYKCNGCGMHAHQRCAKQICLVCPVAFHQDQIMAAFARCFASLFYTYRKALSSATKEQKKNGQLYRFNWDSFLRSVPHEQAEYLQVLKESQGMQQFISEREYLPASDPAIRLFDEMILAKRNRGAKRQFFSSSQKRVTSFLSDSTDHLWHTAQAAMSQRERDSSATLAPGVTPLTTALGRMPANLDKTLMREPRFFHGVAQVNKAKGLRRKQVPSMVGAYGAPGQGGGGPPSAAGAASAIQASASDPALLAPRVRTDSPIPGVVRRP